MKNLVIGFVAAAVLAGALCADADVVTDANTRAAEIAAKHPATPPAVRTMAIVQVSVFEAVSAITGRYPAFRAKVTAPPGASVEAAVASATRTALLKLMPAQQAAIDADYQAALKPLADGRAKSDGIAVGEQAASYDRRRLRAHDVPGRASLGQAQAVGDGQRRPVPPGSSAQLDQ